MTRPHRPFALPVIGIVGWKKSGKTTLVVRLVEELTRRGHVVATLKHAHHSFQIDTDATDSARHRKAGARQVAIVSEHRWAMVTELEGASEPDFGDVLAWLDPADIVVVEGYKSAPIPKIEARRRESFEHVPLADRDPNVVAIAADHAVESALPVFALDDIAAITDFIIRHVGPVAASRSRTE